MQRAEVPRARDARTGSVRGKVARRVRCCDSCHRSPGDFWEVCSLWTGPFSSRASRLSLMGLSVYELEES